VASCPTALHRQTVPPQECRKECALPGKLPCQALDSRSWPAADTWGNSLIAGYSRGTSMQGPWASRTCRSAGRRRLASRACTAFPMRRDRRQSCRTTPEGHLARLPRLLSPTGLGRRVIVLLKVDVQEPPESVQGQASDRAPRYGSCPRCVHGAASGAGLGADWPAGRRWYRYKGGVLYLTVPDLE